MPIRDVLVTAIVLGTLPFILKHAYVGVLLWTWISIMNPHKLAWGFAADAPFAAIAASVTLLSLFTTRDRVQLPLDPIVVLLLVFIAWMGLTTILAIDPQLSLVQLEKVLKIQLITLVAIAVLHDKKQIHLFIWIIAISLGFYGAKGGLFTLLTGGGSRVYGPSGGFISENNALALATIMLIPLLYFLWLVTANRWIRRGVMAVMLLSVASALGSQSRGALLAIVAMAAFLWLRSPRKIAYGIPMLIIGVALVLFMPETWVSRMETIQSYQEDSSAMGRINAWLTMLNIANDRFFGGGFEVYNQFVYQIYSPNPALVKAAHSIYFQVLGEHGWVGLLLFVSLWLLVWREAGKLRRKSSGRNDVLWVYHLAGMIQVSLIGYAVGGAFLSLAYFDLPYNILVLVVVVRRWLAEYLKRADAGVPKAEAAGVMKAGLSGGT